MKRLPAWSRIPTPLSLLLAFSLIFGMGVAGCGGGSSGDFSLAASPAAASVTSGAGGVPISVTATSVGGFTQPVTVALSGLPTGVSASPSMLTLMPGAAQTTTITAAAGAPAATGALTLTGTSGPLTHTATVPITVTAPAPPPADFNLSVSPSSLTIVAGAAGSPLSVIANPLNGFAGMVAVTLSGLPAGVTASPATLTLSPGTAQSITLAAAATAVAGNSTITFAGASGSQSHSATLALTVQPAVTPPSASPDVTTYHFDNTRDGLNAQETILTPANVNATSFGKVGFDSVDGKVDAQPLYVHGLTLPSAPQAPINLLYVATEHDSVYAFNADTGALVWHVSVLATNETTSDDRGCGQISPEIGITSTPVIDRSHGAHGMIFVVGMTKDAAGGYHQRLHALDLVTGAELSGSPTEIQATYPGSGAGSQGGSVVFNPAQYAERAGLLLLNGTLYLAWTSHCDIAPYTGWVMGYDENTLAQTTVLNLTPNGTDGAIWMSGNGLAADSGGNIYLLDANGTLDPSFNTSGFPSLGDYGNAILKLSTSGGKLAVADFFEPFNTAQESATDQDLGSGGALLLPDLADATGHIHHLLVGAGKDTNIYVADRDNLGKFNPANNSNLYQEIPGALPNGVWASPAYFNGMVYYGSVGEVLRAFSIQSAKLVPTPASTSVASFPYPGTTPSVSANGTQNGIVWALESSLSAPAVLHAYDATSLTKELYNSNQATGGRDTFGNGNKFITPVIANGRVYLGTQNGVAIFGLLNPPLAGP